MKLEDYDKNDLVAQNDNGDKLYIVKWGNFYHYFLQHKDQEGFTTGSTYTSKEKCINDAYQFALSSFCGCFSLRDVLDQYPKLTTVTLTQDEITSINIAIDLLGRSSSDHAEQAYFYLKRLSERL